MVWDVLRAISGHLPTKDFLIPLRPEFPPWFLVGNCLTSIFDFLCKVFDFIPQPSKTVSHKLPAWQVFYQFGESVDVYGLLFLVLVSRNDGVSDPLSNLYVMF